jgi:hypothetical protein
VQSSEQHIKRQAEVELLREEKDKLSRRVEDLLVQKSDAVRRADRADMFERENRRLREEVDRLRAARARGRSRSRSRERRDISRRRSEDSGPGRYGPQVERGDGRVTGHEQRRDPRSREQVVGVAVGATRTSPGSGRDNRAGAAGGDPRAVERPQGAGGEAGGASRGRETWCDKDTVPPPIKRELE